MKTKTNISAKILMVGLTPPLEGGSERHIYELSSRMKNVTVLTQKGTLCDRKIELPLVKKSIFLRNISFFLRCFLYSMYLLFAKKKYDVVHIHENVLYFLVPLLKLKYKIIVTVHGINGFKFYDNKILRFFFKIPLQFADALIAVNKEDKKILDKLGERVYYLPNGVDLRIYENVKTAVRKKISFIGRIHEQKGIIYLLEAFSLLVKKHPEFELEIIGEVNDYAHELKNKFSGNKIKWRGFLKGREEIAKSLKSAYCIVLPSVWEGLPLTLFEALASGRPVILSDIPAFRSVIKDEAVFFKVKNSQDLEEKMEMLIKNIKKANDLGLKGEKLSKEYDWEKIAKKTQELY